jgi:ABC-2 type transport system permease protein
MSSLSHPSLSRLTAAGPDRAAQQAASQLGRRLLADSHRRTIAFASLFALVAWVQPYSYRHAYPTLAERVGFARSFGGNLSLRMFYGIPHDLLSIGGYTAWRVGGILAVIAAVWAVVSVTGVLRGEEDSGRLEMLLALPVSRGTIGAAGMGATAVQGLVIWLALTAGLLAGGLPAGPAAFLAIAIVSVIPVLAGVAALASQLAGTRRRAMELALGIVAVAFVLRVVADTVSGAAALRWVSPFGWVEQMRPFAGARPAVLVLPLATGTLLLVLAARLARRRDTGTGLLQRPDMRRPRLRLLSSAAAQTLRAELSPVVIWTAAIAVYGFIVGEISSTISSAGIPAGLRDQLAKLGAGSVITPRGYLGFVFLFFVLVASLFAASQVGAMRNEELNGRLETVLAQAVSRRGWLAARMLVAVGATALISVTAGVTVWAGARLAGVGVSLSSLLLAGANCFAVGTLFLGLATLAYAIAPRAGAALAYGAVTVAFLWQLFGSLLGVPGWIVRLTPFAHLGLTPAQPFQTGSAAVMVLIGLSAAAVARAAFIRRDLTSGG